MASAKEEPENHCACVFVIDLFALNRYAGAAAYLERASQLQPDDLPTLNILGQGYWRIRQYSGVTRVFDRIMAINPGSPEAHFMMGLADDIEYKKRDAYREFQAVLAADPRYPSVHSSLGLIDWRENKFEDAEHEFRQELQNYPSDPISNYMMGPVFLEKNKSGEA